MLTANVANTNHANTANCANPANQYTRKLACTTSPLLGKVDIRSQRCYPLIIESVDSIYRESVDTQYMLIQISQNLYNSCNTLPFIFECFHDEQHTQWR